MKNDLRSETLGAWAKRIGVNYRTAWRWFRNQRLPQGVFVDQMPSGTLLVRDLRTVSIQREVSLVAIYVRINPREARTALQSQVDACKRFCEARGWAIGEIVREYAPGLGPRRNKLARLVEKRVPRIVVAKMSILSRFDFAFQEALFRNLGIDVVVVDRSEEIGGKGGALEDLTDAINLTCHRHYGPKRGLALADMLNRVADGKIIV
jgi:putative resolvase